MATKPSTRSTPRKPTATRATIAKPESLVADRPNPAAPARPELKRQELLAEVVKRAEIKKKAARPVLEAALAVIGEALAEGRDLNLAPLGKIRINRMRDLPNGRILIARIRQGAGDAETTAREDGDDVKEVVAEPTE
ncbi:HU family DNA-binding protein [Roseovarius autotrophicus]|uniref:HU family DNA-binding protein n=1 Tax=Roseovarius autotrophicus TaxID=2824121 RepID=UPI001A0FD3E5|nr:HU family DNA-binding protein [Roseovarius autotrophicus]MBE0452521.1 HU family DNA-binding protein [Roseovarius sp.]